MVKEVELKKINNVSQYVDWETGEELFKRSDCIPKKVIQDIVDNLNKELSSDEPMRSSEFEHKYLAFEFYSELLKAEDNGS